MEKNNLHGKLLEFMLIEKVQTLGNINIKNKTVDMLLSIVKNFLFQKENKDHFGKVENVIVQLVVQGVVAIHSCIVQQFNHQVLNLNSLFQQNFHVHQYNDNQAYQQDY